MISCSLDWLIWSIQPLFCFDSFLLLLCPVSPRVHKRSDNPGAGIEWLQTHICYLYSRANQTEMAHPPGCSHRAGDAWLGEERAWNMGNWAPTTCTALCDFLAVWLTVCSSYQLALLSVSCCDSRGIQGPPSKQAIWSVTCKGDIFVSEPTKELEASPYPTPCDQM